MLPAVRALTADPPCSAAFARISRDSGKRDAAREQSVSRRLADALSVMLPSPKQTLFFRSCLFDGPALAQAWREWLASGDPLSYLRYEGREMRRFLPLLYHNVAENGEDVPPALKPYLHASMLRERLRWELFETCTGDSLQILLAGGVDVTVLKGAAAAQLFFTPPLLRHCHDLDLWVTGKDRILAVAALAAEGFTIGDTRMGTTRCEHPRGLPVMLHTGLIRSPSIRVPEEEVRARRRTIETPNGEWKVLAPSDMLLHSCGQASVSARRPHANWVIDAYRMSAEMDDDDWTQFLDLARRTGLSLSLLVLLRYLKENLAARVPSDAIAALARGADDLERVSLMSTIDGAWLGQPGGIASMLRKSGWRSRVTLARMLVFPPAEYLRATRGSMSRVRLAFEYPARAVRYLVRSSYRRTPEYAASLNGSDSSHHENDAATDRS
jgi:hypothetical protein